MHLRHNKSFIDVHRQSAFKPLGTKAMSLLKLGQKVREASHLIVGKIKLTLFTLHHKTRQKSY